MAQFDVYSNPVEELHASHPYVVGIQSNFLKRPVGVITVSLARPDTLRDPATTLNPWLNVTGETLVLETLAITLFEPSDLRRPVANLQADAAAIWDALDFAPPGSPPPTKR
jgi:toxin CcdB